MFANFFFFFFFFIETNRSDSPSSSPPWPLSTRWRGSSSALVQSSLETRAIYTSTGTVADISTDKTSYSRIVTVLAELNMITNSTVYLVNNREVGSGSGTVAISILQIKESIRAMLGWSPISSVRNIQSVKPMYAKDRESTLGKVVSMVTRLLANIMRTMHRERHTAEMSTHHDQHIVVNI